ncbi:MAG: TldD/PmbA family protein [Candidatus Eremiobacteraeota bacterium]|nr:TldD/PmbA family protein [Candidatus Eremiobacteraeota bacterium]
MPDRATLESMLAQALRLSKADETEALISARDESLTRYTHNFIHESVSQRDAQLNVRAVNGKRAGVASTNTLDQDGIRAVVQRAYDIAQLSTEDKDFAGLPAADDPAGDVPNAFDPDTAAAPAEARAAAVSEIAKVMRLNNLYGAGYVSTEHAAIAIANSKGVKRFFEWSDAAINIKAIGSNASGYAEGFSRSFGELDPSVLATRAAKKAVDGKNPVALDPGKYTVVLEPPAFREFLGYLSWIGFGAQPFEQGASFMSGRIGQQIVGTNITIRDDFAHPLGDGIPFDFEGVPRQKVGLIENGIARNVVYDSYYAAKLAQPNTGHALPAPNTDGPMPLNIVVDPGSRDQDDLIKDIKHGVLVSRTWYIRLVDQKKTIITGMTRDGLFLIERGRVTRGLKNMRFNESIIDALGRCEVAAMPVRSENHVLPAVRIDDFHFSSGTEF